MKVSCFGARGLGREGAAEGAPGKQRKRGRPHGQKTVWGSEQAVELSRLVLGFVRQRKSLPDVGDRGFWQLCHDVLKGVFTHRQVQAKVRYMHLRFRRLTTSGTPKPALVAHDKRQILQIWTHILQLISPSSSTPSSNSLSGQFPSSPPSTQSYPPSAQAGLNEMQAPARVKQSVSRGINGMGSNSRGDPGVGPTKKPGLNEMQVPARVKQSVSPGINGMGGNSRSDPGGVGPTKKSGVNEMRGPARVSPGINGMAGNSRVNPSFRPANKGGNSAGAEPAARQEPQETSTCSTECVDDYQEEFNSHGEFQNNAARGRAASSGLDDDEFTHNNALLHHLTVADLAAAVRTLAEIIGRGPKV